MKQLRYLSTCLRMSRRLLRAKSRWFAAVPSLVVAALIVVSYLSLNSLTLAPEQILQRDMGGFSASIGFGSQPVQPGDRSTLARMERGVRAATDGPVFASLSVVGVRVDGASTVVREGDWQKEPFPDRYRLRSGRWATDVGETVVVVGEGDARRVPSPGEDLELLSGHVPLHVVGVATDRFERESLSLLVGPGTWARTPVASAKAFPAVSAYPVVYWNGKRPSAVRRVLVDAFDSVDPDLSSEALRSSVDSSILDAPTLIGGNPDRWVIENPAGYSIPSLGLPLLGVAIAMSITFAQARRTARTLYANGVPARWAAASPGVALLATTLSASVAGCLAGWLVAAGVRPVLGRFHDQPLGPFEIPSEPMVRILAGVVLAGLACSVILVADMGLERRKHRASSRSPLRLRDVRHVMAIGAAGVAIFMIRSLSGPPQAMAFAAACAAVLVLMAPEFLRAGCRILSERNASTRLARRQLENNAYAPVSVAVTAFVVASSVGFTALLSTMIATIDGRQTPDVLPGQVLVADRATPVVPPPTAVSRLVEASGVLDHSVKVPLAFATHGIQGAPGSRTITVRGESGYVMVVDDVTDAEALLGGHWRSSYAELLAGGGLLLWSGSNATTPDPSMTVELMDSDAPGRPAATVTGLAVDAPRVGWKAGKSSLMLRSTAAQLGLPVSRGAVLYSNVSSDQTRELQQTLADAGLDPSTIAGFSKPAPPIPPVGLVATAFVLALLCLLVVGLESGARAQSLRDSLSRLVAVGVSPRWARNVLMRQQAVLSLVAVVLGLVGGVLPLVLAAQLMSGQWVLLIPWSQIVTLVGACLGGAGLATWMGARRLDVEAVT